MKYKEGECGDRTDLHWKPKGDTLETFLASVSLITHLKKWDNNPQQGNYGVLARS